LTGSARAARRAARRPDPEGGGHVEGVQDSLKGNAVDLAIGVIIGGAFGGIVTSLVNDVSTKQLLGGVDFSNFFVVLGTGGTQLKAAKDAGAATVNGLSSIRSSTSRSWLALFVVRG
jgi:hypothetical protein